MACCVYNRMLDFCLDDNGIGEGAAAGPPLLCSDTLAIEDDDDDDDDEDDNDGSIPYDIACGCCSLCSSATFESNASMDASIKANSSSSLAS